VIRTANAVMTHGAIVAFFFRFAATVDAHFGRLLNRLFGIGFRGLG
jgi:hypothetical protein